MPVGKLKQYIDHYITTYDQNEAKDKYAELIDLESTYIATIAVPEESTDYEKGAYLVVWTEELE